MANKARMFESDSCRAVRLTLPLCSSWMSLPAHPVCTLTLSVPPVCQKSVSTVYQNSLTEERLSHRQSIDVVVMLCIIYSYIRLIGSVLVAFIAW